MVNGGIVRDIYAIVHRRRFLRRSPRCLPRPIRHAFVQGTAQYRRLEWGVHNPFCQSNRRLEGRTSGNGRDSGITDNFRLVPVGICNMTRDLRDVRASARERRCVPHRPVRLPARRNRRDRGILARGIVVLRCDRCRRVRGSIYDAGPFPLGKQVLVHLRRGATNVATRDNGNGRGGRAPVPPAVRRVAN